MVTEKVGYYLVWCLLFSGGQALAQVDYEYTEWGRSCEKFLGLE